MRCDPPHRGLDTCGDIDVIITRSGEDGKTHAGGYPYVVGVAPVLYMGLGFVTYLLSMDLVMLNRCCEEIMAGVPCTGHHY
jgi:hypothetical protein